MAEFDGLDSRLRDALGQAATPGDSAGVADAIRSRVAAGDPGASVASSTAPGWGGGGLLGWLPVLGIVVAAIVAGGGIGASGLAGRPVETVDAASPVVVRVTVAGLACVDGPVVDDIPAGTPVLATLRSDDGSWVGVRSPAGDGSVLWIPAAVLTLDEGQPDVAGLPVGGACPVVVTPTPTPTPEPTPDPVPVPDTTAPTVQASANPGVVYWANGTSTTITAATSDNRAVAGVSISWSGYASGSAEMSGGGSAWTYLFDPPGEATPVPPGSQITFVVTARDAAGNTATSTVSVQVSS
jgi:hypothetical protein